MLDLYITVLTCLYLFIYLNLSLVSEDEQASLENVEKVNTHTIFQCC